MGPPLNMGAVLVYEHTINSACRGVITFTQALCDEAKKDGWTVISSHLIGTLTLTAIRTELRKNSQTSP